MTCKGRGRPEGGNRNLRKNSNYLNMFETESKNLKVTMTVS